MPNLQLTTMTIGGGEAELDKLTGCIVATEVYLERVEKRNATLPEDFRIVAGRLGEIDFNILIPRPEYIFGGILTAETEKQYGKNNWLDWSTENWGTKWNALDADFCRKNENLIELSFFTAWDAPLPWIEALAAKAMEIGVRYMRGTASIDYPIEYYEFKLNTRYRRMQYRLKTDYEIVNDLMQNK